MMTLAELDELEALLPEAEPAQRAAAARMLEAELHDWNWQAREKQLPPEGDWIIWLLVTGRGWGKTRTAAEWLRQRALGTVGSYGICAPTYGDARDICVEGGDRHHPSGLISVCRGTPGAPGAEIVNYNRSLGELWMRNGSKIKMLSADEPDRARGWGFVAAWCDEFSSWRRPATWYETVLPATRMANRHRFVITTTPKPNRLTVDLVEQARTDPRVRLVTGHSMENAANLGAGVIEDLQRGMTARLARQELAGEVLTDVPGALWRLEMIDRVDDFPELARLVIAVDPAVTSDEGSDESGIVAVGRSGNDAYVLEDWSAKRDPHATMETVARLYHELAADRVVIEKNNGGDYLPALLRTIDPTIPVETVWAKRGKELRAEPVAGLYEHGRVHHVGTLADLETQLITWAPGGPSPDRLDALVYGVTALFPELARGERVLRFRGMA